MYMRASVCDSCMRFFVLKSSYILYRMYVLPCFVGVSILQRWKMLLEGARRKKSIANMERSTYVCVLDAYTTLFFAVHSNWEHTRDAMTITMCSEFCEAECSAFSFFFAHPSRWIKNDERHSFYRTVRLWCGCMDHLKLVTSTEY